MENNFFQRCYVKNKKISKIKIKILILIRFEYFS